MNCGQARQLLDAWLDRELDAATHADMDRHVRECAECATARTERVALRAGIRNAAPRYTAPLTLRSDVRRLLQAASSPTTRTRAAPTWWQAFGLAFGTGLAGVIATWLFLQQQPVDRDVLSDELVGRHVAALASGLTEVSSSDRHAVKPWFHGKVAFAPAVRDLAPQGFTLKGARLDHVAGQQAAAVVYQIRNHPIDLFIWRTTSKPESTGLQMTQARGFAMATWSTGGLRFAALSDVDPRELERFAREMSTTP